MIVIFALFIVWAFFYIVLRYLFLALFLSCLTLCLILSCVAFISIYRFSQAEGFIDRSLLRLRVYFVNLSHDSLIFRRIANWKYQIMVDFELFFDSFERISNSKTNELCYNKQSSFILAKILIIA